MGIGLISGGAWGLKTNMEKMFQNELMKTTPSIIEFMKDILSPWEQEKQGTSTFSERRQIRKSKDVMALNFLILVLLIQGDYNWNFTVLLIAQCP